MDFRKVQHSREHFDVWIHRLGFTVAFALQPRLIGNRSVGEFPTLICDFAGSILGLDLDAVQPIILLPWLSELSRDWVVGNLNVVLRLVSAQQLQADYDDIHVAMVGMYKRFQQLVCRQIDTGHGSGDLESGLPTEMAASGLPGLTTVSNIIRKLTLLPPRQRERMYAAVAKCPVSGKIS